MPVLDLERLELPPELVRSPRWRNLYYRLDDTRVAGLGIHPTRAVARAHADEFFRDFWAWVREYGFPAPEDFTVGAIQVPEPDWPLYF